MVVLFEDALARLQTSSLMSSSDDAFEILTQFMHENNDIFDLSALGMGKNDFSQLLVDYLKEAMNEKDNRTDRTIEGMQLCLGCLRICSRSCQPDDAWLSDATMEVLVNVATFSSTHYKRALHCQDLSVRIITNILFQLNDHIAVFVNAGYFASILDLIEQNIISFPIALLTACVKLAYLITAMRFEVSKEVAFQSDLHAICCHLYARAASNKLEVLLERKLLFVELSKLLFQLFSDKSLSLLTDYLREHSSKADKIKGIIPAFEDAVIAIIALPYADNLVYNENEFYSSFQQHQHTKQQQEQTQESESKHCESPRVSTKDIYLVQDHAITDLIQIQQYAMQLSMILSTSFDSVGINGPNFVKKVVLDESSVIERFAYCTGVALKLAWHKHSQEKAAVMTPSLATLLNFAKSSETARRRLKSIIFPNEVDLESMTHSGVMGASDSTDPLSRFRGPHLMHPHAPGIPKGGLLQLLLPNMISIDTMIKRLSSELLYALCDSDDEFVFRTGFGNAIALLQAKMNRCESKS